MEYEQPLNSKIKEAALRLPQVDVSELVMERIEQGTVPAVITRRPVRSYALKGTVIAVILILSVVGGVYAEKTWFGQRVKLHNANGAAVSEVQIEQKENVKIEGGTLPSTSYADYASFNNALPASLSPLNLKAADGFVFKDGKISEYQIADQKFYNVTASYNKKQNPDRTYTLSIEIGLTPDLVSSRPSSMLISDDPNLKVTVLTHNRTELMFAQDRSATSLSWSIPYSEGHLKHFSISGPSDVTAEELKAAAKNVLP